MSGAKNSDVIDKLRQNITDLEAKRDKLIESSQSRVFEWASKAFRSNGEINSGDKLSEQVREIIAEYDSINNEIVEKEMSL